VGPQFPVRKFAAFSKFGDLGILGFWDDQDWLVSADDHNLNLIIDHMVMIFHDSGMIFHSHGFH
jgi:hypothetical protein